MPPKVKAEPVPTRPPVPEVDIKLKFTGSLDQVPYTSLHVKVISSWFDCFRTEVYFLIYIYIYIEVINSNRLCFDQRQLMQLDLRGLRLHRRKEARQETMFSYHLVVERPVIRIRK